jgi:hypothetical protein
MVVTVQENVTIRECVVNIHATGEKGFFGEYPIPDESG